MTFPLLRSHPNQRFPLVPKEGEEGDGEDEEEGEEGGSKKKKKGLNDYNTPQHRRFLTHPQVPHGKRYVSRWTH